MKLSIDRPVLCLITSGELTSENFHERKAELVEHCIYASDRGITLIQIREKKLQTDLLCELTAQIVRETHAYPTYVVVNERFDIAIAAGANGVHLTSTGLPTQRVRELVPTDFMVGRSAHTYKDVSAASRDGADYVLLGTMYETPGKYVALVLDELMNVCKDFPDLPILGLGGIDASNVHEVLNAGAAGVAAIRSMNDRRKMDELISRVREGAIL